jgi:AraC family transcriptional regulator
MALHELQCSTLFSARGFRHHADVPSPPLSIKCMFNGIARYRIDRGIFAVDETGYLVLNDGQRYVIEIDSPTAVESFVVFFPRDWAAEVLRTLATRADRLLDDPAAGDAAPVHFFERFTPHDVAVSPCLVALRQAHRRGGLDDFWIEQRLRELLAAMLGAQRAAFREIETFPGHRPATRQEIWRRLHRARDYMRAESHSRLTLARVAREACLSPFHFLRSFKAAFGLTPYEFLATSRFQRAQFLIERTDLPITEICFAVGFESLGSFSSWFSRQAGCSPRAWRRKRAISKKFSVACPATLPA